MDRSSVSRRIFFSGLFVACLAVAGFALPANFTATNLLPTIKRGTTVVQTADSRLFITELGGDFKTYKNGSSYTLHHFPTSTGDQDYHVIMRFTVSPPLGGNPQLVPGSEYLIYRMPNPPGGASRHNGGHIVFGNDGYLYIAKGEGEHQEWAEDETKVFGKLIRIDAHSTSRSNDNVNGHYGIPPGNPGWAKPEIFAKGFRNPWSMTKDPSSADIYIGDVGGTEEVNRVIPSLHSGKRFGWGPGGAGGLWQVRYEGTPVPPSITTHPQNTSVSSGNQAALTVVASGPSLAYQWQSAPTGSTAFGNIANNTTFAGATTAGLTLNATRTSPPPRSPE